MKLTELKLVLSKRRLLLGLAVTSFALSLFYYLNSSSNRIGGGHSTVIFHLHVAELETNVNSNLTLSEESLSHENGYHLLSLQQHGQSRKKNSSENVNSKNSLEFVTPKLSAVNGQPVTPSAHAHGENNLKETKEDLHLPPADAVFFKSSPVPTIMNYTCKENMCLELLSRAEKRQYTLCTQRTIQLVSKGKPRGSVNPASINGECHFMNGAERAAVALVSFPGSGNTWVRGLLEQASGICTGSVYMDTSLRSAGMNGEGMDSGAVIAVKLHDFKLEGWSKRLSDKFGSAIVIIRNPFDALVSEWTRQMSHNHIGTVSHKHFGNNIGWKTFIDEFLPMWQSYYENWLVKSGTHSVLVIRYEDIKADILGTVRKMLDFLRFHYDPRELEERMSRDYGTFKRKHNDDFQHFTPNQRTKIRNAISETVAYLKTNHHDNSLGVETYLQ